MENLIVPLQNWANVVVAKFTKYKKARDTCCALEGKRPHMRISSAMDSKDIIHISLQT